MILFSPIGTTDPVRNFRDGGCLHIIRHYLKKGITKVILFYTADIGNIQKEYEPYTRAIKYIAPELEIEEIFSEINEPQLYDSFIEIFPKIIYGLHEKYPEEKIILNLSSGTPQMKNLLAILSVENDWTLAVQVNSPQGRANWNLPHISAEEDFLIMLWDNDDDKKNAENRCIEPPLRVLKLYSDKNKILSLINQYEYDAALTIAKQNPNISEDVKNLLKHAALRLKLRTTDAQKILPKYDGKNLFPFSGTQKKLTEYLLTIQSDREVGNLSSVLIKTVPFLYEFLAEYVLHDDKLKIRKSCVEYKKKDSPLLETNLELKRDLLKKNNPELLNFLDLKFRSYYEDKFLSERVLKFICEFAAHYSEDKFYTEILTKLQDLEERNVINLRNKIAHIIADVDEKKFKAVTGMTSNELVEYFFRMMYIMYGKEIRAQRNLYAQINAWVKAALEK